jgi:hypothetical protein
MTIPTPQSRARHARRLDRLNRKVESVLAAMRDGAVLRRVHLPRSIVWMLSTGEAVTADAARLVIERSEIADVGDCLFGFEFSQTWRFIDR